MKTLFLTACILIAVCGCASAAPPAHKTFQICCTMPGVDVTGCNFYKAHPTDTAWTLEGSIAATNGQTVAVTFDATYELHTADCTNSLTGQFSDYAPILTNQIPAAPSAPGLKK